MLSYRVRHAARRLMMESLEQRRMLAAEVVINEFLALNKDGARDVDGESSDWIELANRGDEPASLAGYFLTDDPEDLQKWEFPDVTLSAGEARLLFASGKDRRDAAAELHTNFRLNGDGEYLALVKPDGLSIAFAYAPGFPVQFENISYGLGSDGIAQGYFANPSPHIVDNGEPVTDPATRVLISEIMYHTPSGRADEEYLEIFNAGLTPVELADWQFSRGVAFDFPSYELAAGAYLVVAADRDVFQARYGLRTNVIGGWSGGLSNGGETLELRDQRGALVDRLRYADEGDWSVRERGPEDANHYGWEWSDAHDGGGHSLELINPALDNAWGQNWAASLALGGSPGEVNGRFSNDIAPLIVDVAHEPIVPRAQDAVSIRATVIDELATGSQVTLHWRVDGTTAFQSVVMQTIGADEFRAVVPPQADLSIVEFYLTAGDESGHTRAFPAVDPAINRTTQQAPNLLYQVDNSFASEIAGFAPTSAAFQPVFRLIMTDAERAELAQIGSGSDSDSNAQMNATFIRHDGTTVDARYNVGLRNRGKGSRPKPPNNYRVNFAHDQPWNGVTAINLNSKQPYAQIIGSVLFQRAGLAAGNASATRVRVNGADLSQGDPAMFGAYNYLEVIDSDFADLHLPNDSNGNVYTVRWDGRIQADLRYEGDDPAAYRDRYAKNTNVAEDDWSDFLRLVDVLNNAPAESFLKDVQEVIDLDQWLTFLAFDTLLTNRETSLSRGTGDDYDLYRGVNDPRFIIIPHDMDSILGATDPAVDYSIWLPADVDGLTRLLTHPDVAPRYYQKLLDLVRDVYHPQVAGKLIDQFLGGWVAPEMITRMKQFMAARTANVLSQIPQQLTIASDLNSTNGLPFTSAATAALHGLAPVAETRRLEVNGVPASYDIRTGTWSTGNGNLPLQRGLNRFTVRAWDAAGELVAESSLDVWRDSGTQQTVSGTIATDAVWTADRRWVVTSNLTVASGATLTIDPGTVVTVAAGAAINVQGQGIARGSATQPIRLTRSGSSGAWNGLIFSNTPQANELTFVDLAYSDGSGQSVEVDHARLAMDHVQWLQTTRTALEVSHPSLVVTNSRFPSIIDNETVHGSGLSGSEYFILQGNVFGTTTGYSDVVDFTGGQRPGPIIQVIDNVFLGGSDDGLDLDGTDAYIAGNFFQNFHKDNSSDSSSNAIATGVDSGNASELVIVGNTFYNVDHALLLKERSSATFENNVVVAASMAAINFDEPNRDVAPGAGISIAGSIFWQNEATLQNFGRDPLFGDPQITIHDSLLPSEFHALGDHNLEANPAFRSVRAFEPSELVSHAIGVDAGLFALRDDSPARNAGGNGQDQGSRVARVATLAGEPEALTMDDSARLTVGGPDIASYRYRLVGPGADAGEFGPERPIDEPISFVGLQPGTYVVEVIGRDSRGIWQELPSATRSRSWTVSNDPNQFRVRLNEIAAWLPASDGTGDAPDFVELFNPTSLRVSLAGMSLSDDEANPTRFIFPPETWIEPLGYVVVQAVGPDSSPPGGAGEPLRTGFGLHQGGDALFLFAAPENGGGLIDAITFGMQIPHFSVGRVGPAADWGLTQLTPGTANQRQPTGASEALRINEWFTSGDIRLTDDFVELHNPDSLPVALSGLTISDNATSWPMRHEFAPLTFLGAQSFQALVADGNASGGADHLSFRLTSNTGQLGLYDAEQSAIDVVLYGPQQTDVSEGLAENRGGEVRRFELPTPGLPNAASDTTITETATLVPFAATWAYEESGTNLGTAWRAPTYSDQNWSRGAAPLGVEESPLPIPLATALNLGPTTFYFRTSFPYTVVPVNEVADVRVSLQTLIDDGAVIYLNGTEIFRQNMPAGTIAYATNASNAVTNASLAGAFEVPAELLVDGPNVLAVEVHQSGSNSSDIVFALELQETKTIRVMSALDNDARLVAGLRITEIMYHPPAATDPEFIELQNTGATPLELAGVRLAGGVEFTFPALQLPPQAYVVVTNDQAAFTARYGTSALVAGEYTGSLANQGESLTLQLPHPQTVAIQRFGYDDEGDQGWPTAADGAGASLQVVDVSGDYRAAANWRASSRTGGTPGFDSELPIGAGDINLDGAVDASDIDRLFAAIAAHEAGSAFDLNRDEMVNLRDVDFLVRNILQTAAGDADLNGRIDFADFVTLANRFGRTGSWQQGDFDGDGLVGFADFVTLATNFGFARPGAKTLARLDEIAAALASFEK